MARPRWPALPTWRYILVKQLYPYDDPGHHAERATNDSYATLAEARSALSEYMVRNYIRTYPINDPPGGLCGYEGGFEKCLDMQGDEIVGRVWVDRVRLAPGRQ